MPQGPFASSVGVGRAEPEWANLNLVKDVMGKDPFFESGETSEAPLPLPPVIMNGDLSSAPKHVDLLIVGAGLSGAIIAERCSKEFGYKSLIIDVRDHIGGNCYDFVEEHGLRASTRNSSHSPHSPLFAARSSFVRVASPAQRDEQTIPPETPNVRSANSTGWPAASVACPPASCTQMRPHA